MSIYDPYEEDPNDFEDDVPFYPEYTDKDKENDILGVYHDDPDVEDESQYDEPPEMTDVEADANALEGIGHGDDEAYGYYGQDE